MKRTPEKRRALLTFVVVGGGPTGVETAGALAELIRLVMTKDYPDMDLQEVRVLLLEAADHLMGTYPPGLRQATYDLLKGQGCGDHALDAAERVRRHARHAGRRPRDRHAHGDLDGRRASGRAGGSAWA